MALKMPTRLIKTQVAGPWPQSFSKVGTEGENGVELGDYSSNKPPGDVVPDHS